MSPFLMPASPHKHISEPCAFLLQLPALPNDTHQPNTLSSPPQPSDHTPCLGKTCSSDNLHPSYHFTGCGPRDAQQPCSPSPHSSCTHPVPLPITCILNHSKKLLPSIPSQPSVLPLCSRTSLMKQIQRQILLWVIYS